MYIPHKAKKGLKSLIIIVIVGALIPLVIWGMNQYLEYRSGAAPTIKPEDVRVTDITDTSLTVSWVTPNDEAEGYVIYGTDDLSRYTRDIRDIHAGKLVERSIHYVVLENLKPGTTYKYKIVSGSKKFGDSKGDAFTFRTLSSDQVSLTGTPDPVQGTVLNGKEKSAIVYLNLEKGGTTSNVLSSLTNEEGGWEIDLSRIRSADGTSEFDYKKDTKMVVVAKGGLKGGSSVVAKVNTPIQDLDMTMDSSFSEDNLLADESSRETEGEGDDVDQDEGSSGDPVDSGGGTGGTPVSEPVEETPVGSDPTRFDDLDWVNLTQEIDLTSSSSVLGESVTVGEESVEITNIRDTQFTVSWITSEKVVGTVEYGDTQEPEIWEEAYDSRDTMASQTEYYVHHINITELDPQGVYYFRINSGSEAFDNDGEFYDVQLQDSLDEPPAVPNPVVGEVEGYGHGDSIAYVSVRDSEGEDIIASELSTLVQDNGSWSISLENAYDISGELYYSPNENDVISVTVKTMGDKDTGEINYGDIEDETVVVELESYGETSSDTGSASLGQNGLLSLDNMRSSPKTGFLEDVLIGFGIAQLFIILGLVIYPDSLYTRWEKNIINNMQNA